MAVVRQRLYRKNANNGYDTIRLETGSDCVLRPDNTTVETSLTNMNTAIAGKANASHKHAASDITSGILPVNHGGTGVDSLDKLKTTLGINSGGSGASYDISGAGVGNYVKWANRTWVVCHTESDKIYLAATFMQTTTSFSSYTNHTSYAGSNLAAAALSYQNTIPADSLALAVDTTVEGVTAKIFAASYAQLTGGFMYFYSNSQRELDALTYWTSTHGGKGFVWAIDTTGRPGNKDYNGYTTTIVYSFRPFVALKRS